MKRAVVILAGGFSKRFGQDKCLVDLAGKPLVVHVLDRVSSIVDEAVVVVGFDEARTSFAKQLKSKANVAVDKYEGHSPLVGALTGFESVSAEYVLLLPCDTPFVSPDIAALLLDCCVGKAAAIPRWPNGYIEPLQAAYHAASVVEAAKKALNGEKRDLLSMINELHGIRYISTLALQQLDPKLLTLFNVNTQQDLKKAESMLTKKKRAAD